MSKQLIINAKDKRKINDCFECPCRTVSAGGKPFCGIKNKEIPLWELGSNADFCPLDDWQEPSEKDINESLIENINKLEG